MKKLNNESTDTVPVIVDVSYSAYKKKFKFRFCNIEYDISDIVPEKVWNIWDRALPIHPMEDWKIRTELRKIFIEYFKKNIDINLRDDNIIF
jgi:hypothetical protein